jgi:hypothetical protein
MADETFTALATKLRLTQETHLLVIGAPDEYIALLRQPFARFFVGSRGLTRGVVEVASQGEVCDAVHLFVRSQAEAEAALPAAVAALRPGGVLWVMWPKTTSGMATDLTRDTLAALALAQGWGPVSNVSIDETWSALRLRPEAEVKRSGQAFGQAFGYGFGYGFGQ